MFSRCTHGINLKRPYHLVLELSHSQTQCENSMLLYANVTVDIWRRETAPNVFVMKLYRSLLIYSLFTHGSHILLSKTGNKSSIKTLKSILKLHGNKNDRNKLYFM